MAIRRALSCSDQREENMTKVQCHIKNESSADLILDRKQIKAMGFAHIAEGKYHWDTEPPGKVSARGGQGSFSATNETIGSYISAGAIFKASVDGMSLTINLGASADSWPGGFITETTELSKKDILNVRVRPGGGKGDRVVTWTITDYPD
jgi:hypothetical protein